MEHLYAPWRGTYDTKARKNGVKDCCPFCMHVASSEDTKNFVIKRFNHTTALLNRYPYNPGHILIIPNRHIARLSELSHEERNELMQAIIEITELLETELANSGTNIGINLGDNASGGSIPEHLHVHIVPRWKGDTNFLPVTANTKPLSQDLVEVFNKLCRSQ